MERNTEWNMERNMEWIVEQIVEQNMEWNRNYELIKMERGKTRNKFNLNNLLI